MKENTFAVYPITVQLNKGLSLYFKNEPSMGSDDN